MLKTSAPGLLHLGQRAHLGEHVDRPFAVDLDQHRQ
jgi:hypothetical protein